MSVDFEYELDSECGYLFERARRRGPVNTVGRGLDPTHTPAAHASPSEACLPGSRAVRGCGPALKTARYAHARELHEVPLFVAAQDDYLYLRCSQKWRRVRAMVTTLRRTYERWQVARMIEIPPSTAWALALWFVFVIGIAVGSRMGR